MASEFEGVLQQVPHQRIEANRGRPNGEVRIDIRDRKCALGNLRRKPCGDSDLAMNCATQIHSLG